MQSNEILLVTLESLALFLCSSQNIFSKRCNLPIILVYTPQERQCVAPSSGFEQNLNGYFCTASALLRNIEMFIISLFLERNI